LTLRRGLESREHFLVFSNSSAGQEPLRCSCPRCRESLLPAIQHLRFRSAARNWGRRGGRLAGGWYVSDWSSGSDGVERRDCSWGNSLGNYSRKFSRVCDEFSVGCEKAGPGTVHACQPCGGQDSSSYKNFSSSVDVRLDFTAGSVDLAVPVLVAVIATDQDQERTWFQMNRDQLSDLVKILQGRLRQMDLAEEWIRARPSGPNDGWLSD